jgi:hypothetical protein
MFFSHLLPTSSNKDIFNVEFLQQCKIRFEPPRHSRNIAQCANCQRYGHTKNFCHLKPRHVKSAGDHSTSQCPRKERSSDVRCVLCNGNHPANYKGCTVYKDLPKKPIHPSDQNNTLPPRPYNKHCTPNLESHTLKSQRLIPALLPHKILPTSTLNPNRILVISLT